MNRTSITGQLIVLAVLAAAVSGCRGRSDTEATAVVSDVEAAIRARSDVFAFSMAETGGHFVVGLKREPLSLFGHGGQPEVAGMVRNAVTEALYETLGYDFQPVLLERLPKLEDPGSGATLSDVPVGVGDAFYDHEAGEARTASSSFALPQLTARFAIRPAVRWEDGQPLTADDLVFGHFVACHPETPFRKELCEHTAEYARVDKRTVEWRGLPGYRSQHYYTHVWPPLPRHQIGDSGMRMDKMDPADLAADVVFSQRPLSYGPYRIVSWEPGYAIELERNDHYWRSDEGLPFLDELTFRIAGDPQGLSLLPAMRRGEVDVALGDWTQYESIRLAEVAGEVWPKYSSGPEWLYIAFNVDPSDDRPAFGACVGLRRAMMLGTDRATMVRVIMNGESAVRNSIVPDEHWSFPSGRSLPTYDFDPDGARRALAELGFVDLDGDGVREATRDIACGVMKEEGGRTVERVIARGTRLEFELLIRLVLLVVELDQDDAVVLFQQNMADIGVGINLRYFPENSLFAPGPDGHLFGRRFDLSVLPAETGIQPPVQDYLCSEIPRPESKWWGRNVTGWCSREYDQLVQQAEGALERSVALPTYNEAQRLLMAEVPIIPLFSRVSAVLTRPGVVNVWPDPTSGSITWNIEAWGFAVAR